MTVNVSTPVAISNGPALRSFAACPSHPQRRRGDRSPRRSPPNSRSTAAKRDRERILPAPKLDQFSESGSVGDHHSEGLRRGGRLVRDPRGSHRADFRRRSSIGQFPQNHLAALDAIRFAGPTRRRAWFGRVLQGYRLGNAFSEAKSKHVGAFETTLTPRRRQLSSSMARSSMRPARCSRISSISARSVRTGMSIWRSRRATRPA